MLWSKGLLGGYKRCAKSAGKAVAYPWHMVMIKSTAAAHMLL
jgi:hypothetical protein